MNNLNELVRVVSHLTPTEVESVAALLRAEKIKFIVVGHDAANRYSSLYYMIRVKKKDYATAKKIIDKKRTDIFIESRKCPNCKILSYQKVEKKKFWERLYYLGTTLVECKKCKKRFPI